MPRINWNLRLVSVGLVIGLVAVIGLEVIGAGIDIVTPWFATDADAPKSSRALTQLANADIMTKDILKRPLFNMTRRPPQPKKIVIEPPVLHGRLAGVMIKPDAKEALFARSGGGMPVVVKEGGQIDGFTLASVEVDRVVLRSSFGDQIFKPTHAAPDEGLPPKPRVIKKHPPTRSGPAPTVAATAAQQVR
jgi:hypothetical protein